MALDMAAGTGVGKGSVDYGITAGKIQPDMEGKMGVDFRLPENVRKGFQAAF